MKMIMAATLMAMSVTAAGAADADGESAIRVLQGCKHIIDPNFGRGTALIDVLAGYIEARPKQMHEQFVVFAIAALAEAWPCPK